MNTAQGSRLQRSGSHLEHAISERGRCELHTDSCVIQYIGEQPPLLAARVQTGRRAPREHDLTHHARAVLSGESHGDMRSHGNGLGGHTEQMEY